MSMPAVETAQDSFELAQLLTIFRTLNPARVLEVGVWHGGTLWHWLQGERVVVAVDDAMSDSDLWQTWAGRAWSTLHLLHGDSHDPQIVEAAREHGPYNFVFIDAGHDYESVKADWDNFGGMVSEGGIVAFHDIAPRPSYGVSDLWAELKPGRRTVELWAGSEAYCGVGLLWL